MRTVVNHLRFILAQWEVNLGSAMAYRTTFLIQSTFMFLNDGFWLFIWWVLLDNFPSIAGWQMGEILLMYGISAGGYGLMAIFAANANRLSQIIAEGQLDYYLALPKNVLIHTLISRTQFDAVGDLAFGIVAVAVGSAMAGTSFLLALVFMFTAGLVFGGFMVIVNSLAFYIGRSSEFSEQIAMSCVTFSMYPGCIFKGFARFLAFFVIPAGFVTHLPVETLRTLNLGGALAVAAAAVVIWIVAVAVFGNGLRKYESGNQMSLRE
ncbi:MAG: ABC transporter permease [Chloroflexota bacterium]